MGKKAIVVIGVVFALLGAGTFGATAQSGDGDSGPADEGLAPLQLDAEAGIDDEYIIVLKADPGALGALDQSSDVAETVVESDGDVLHVLSAAINGLVVSADADAIEQVRADPSVDYVIQNSRIQLDLPAADEARYTWGRDRINQRNLPLDDDVDLDLSGGAGVDVYVIDTGIVPEHQEFAGRSVTGHSVLEGDPWNEDCNTHGTHVAGTAAGSTVGVATEANIIAVKVLTCSGSGTWAGVIEGMDWVANRLDGPSVVNMSLGGGKHPAADQATANLVARGALVTIAAGNSSRDACDDSPYAASAVTVASSAIGDRASSFTNWGTCVDLYAPGSSVLSADAGNLSGYSTKSGTSMAAPHVAGVAAVLWAENPTLSVAELHDALADTATVGAISGGDATTPNRLLYVEPDSTGPGGPVIEVRALGSTGLESIALEVNGTIVDRFSLSTSFETFTHRMSTSDGINSVRVIFDNDAFEPEGDKNVRIDYVSIAGRRIDSEDPFVLSKGTWDGASCGIRYAETEWLHCNGWFDYLYDGSQGSVIEVRTRGSVGSESISIEVDGLEVSRHTLTTSFQTITVRTERPVEESVRVTFDNDAFVPGGDRNVQVDYITVDGRRIETESPNVLSRGNWNGQSCGTRYGQSEWLHCNGWFDYSEALLQ